MLSLAEAAQHPHNVARGSFISVDGVAQPAPAPRFSRTPAGPVEAPHKAGADTGAVLQEAGFSAAEIEALRAAGALSWAGALVPRRPSSFMMVDGPCRGHPFPQDSRPTAARRTARAT